VCKWNQENHFDLDAVHPENQEKTGSRLLRLSTVVWFEFSISGGFQVVWLRTKGSEPREKCYVGTSRFVF
jgi:hypothetical protein